MPRFEAIRRGDALHPTNRWAAEALRRVPEGRRVMVEARQPRRHARHAFWWALCSALAHDLQAAGYDMDAEAVSTRLKIATGHAGLVPVPGRLAGPGGPAVAILPTSIAWHRMDETRFAELLDAAVRWILEQVPEEAAPNAMSMIHGVRKSRMGIGR